MTLEDVLRDPEDIPAVRRWLFEQLAAGRIAPDRAAAIARRIGVELEAERYGVVLFDLPPTDREAGFFTDPAAAVRGALLAYFLKYSEYMPAVLFPEIGAVLIKGEARRMEELTERCIRTVRDRYERAGLDDWRLAASAPAAGLEQVSVCFQEASRLWSLGALRPAQRVFRQGDETLLAPGEDGESFSDEDLLRADPDAIRVFLERGRPEDAGRFAARYLGTLGPAMGSRSFRDYALLSARAAAARFNAGQAWETIGREALDDPARFLADTLAAAMAGRDEPAGEPAGGTLEKALAYVDQNFTDLDLTLAAAAAHAGVTASYLSALFRRRTGVTFTQYVTARRMERARLLLITTDLRPGQIAREAGLRDERYFSALFKRTYGCAPGRFRSGTARED